MADIEQIKADVAALQDAGAAAANELQALVDTVHALKDAGAEAVTDEQLSELHDNLQSVTSALTAATVSARTEVEPPAPEQV